MLHCMRLGKVAVAAQYGEQKRRVVISVIQAYGQQNFTDDIYLN